MDISNRIKELRKELGITQAELARRANVHPPSISQYESGARSPSYEALIKLANALNTSSDFLASGETKEVTSHSDLKSKLLLRIFHALPTREKENVFDFIFKSAGQPIRMNVDSLDPKQYGKYLFEHVLEKKFPVSLETLAESLEITIVKGDLANKAEAALYKKSCLIILDSTINKTRERFAIASLIGHLLIPWHTKDVYFHRQAGTSTLKTEDLEKVEAGAFATALLTPSEELEKDLSIYSSTNASVVDIRNLAKDKYDTSFNILCNRLIEAFPNRFSIIKSSDSKIDSTFSPQIPLREIGTKLSSESKAYTLFKERSNKPEEIKEGIVPASAWLPNLSENDFVYESSIYTLDYNSVFTIITKLK